MKHGVAALLALAISASLTACGSSAPVRYYRLDPMDIDYRRDGDEALLVGLGPLHLPEYLGRSQLVIRGDRSEMIVDDFSRWAEPLDEALPRILASNVDKMLHGVRVVAFPYNNLIDSDYRLIGRVDRFDADQNGLAVLEVQWAISDREGETLLPARRSRYEASVPDPANRSSVARGLNETIDQFSRDIATELEAALL